MFTIIDKTTKKITQTISENYGFQVSENELMQEINDPVLIEKITTAYEYELIFDGDIISGMTVLKTIKEWNADQEPLNGLMPTSEEAAQAEFEIRGINLLIEMGLL